MMAAERMTITTTVWVKISSASRFFPLPRAKAHRVEAPMDRRMDSPDRTLMNGREMFTDVKADSLTPWATRMPSITVYRENSTMAEAAGMT